MDSIHYHGWFGQTCQNIKNAFSLTDYISYMMGQRFSFNLKFWTIQIHMLYKNSLQMYRQELADTVESKDLHILQYLWKSVLQLVFIILTKSVSSKHQMCS